MNSEKVKEIKESLDNCTNHYGTDCYHCPYLEKGCNIKLMEASLTLINELESENERLNKSDTSKEESSIEYYNLYKDLKRKNKDLNELCELQRVSIAESFVRENQLKDRIAELEKENEILKGTKDRLTFADRVRIVDSTTDRVLKQFAERLKEELQGIVGANFIDETLKEFINEKPTE